MTRDPKQTETQAMMRVPTLVPPDPANFTDKAALYAAYAEFMKKSLAQPRDGVAEMDFRMRIEAIVYNLIAAELDVSSETLAAERIILMLKYLDARLVYFAVRWYKRDLLPLVRVSMPERIIRPVRKIGIFCHYLRDGGAERCAALLIHEFIRAGKAVTLFSSEEATASDYAVPEKADRVVLNKLPHERRAQLEIELEARKIDTCIFFDHAEWRTANDILSARAAGARIIAMEHNFYSYPWAVGRPGIAIDRECVYPAADIITVLSRTDRETWRANGFRQAVYLPNPPTFEADEVRPNEGKDAKTLLFVARLTARKGAEKAIDVLNLVRRKHPSARLLMVGRPDSPSYDQFLRNKVSESGLNGAVEFTGQTPDISQYYEKASVLIMPSQMEGFPMTLMEAKAHGLPSVLFAMPYLEAAHAGCIQTPQGDTAAMADAVSKLFEDPERLRQLGEEAKKSLETFSRKSVREQWMRIFSYLEGAIPEDVMFAVPDGAEERLNLLTAGIQEQHRWQTNLLKNPVFLEEIGEKTREEYLSRHPVMHLIDRLHRRMPRAADRFNRVFRAIFRGLLLKKLYRGITRKISAAERNGFPPYD